MRFTPRAASTVADATRRADQQIGGVADPGDLAREPARGREQGRARRAVIRRQPIAATSSRSSSSPLVGGQARVDSDGQMRFVLDGGAVLVDGNHAAIDVDRARSDDRARRPSWSSTARTTRDVTTQIAGGQLGGQLAAARPADRGRAPSYDQSRSTSRRASTRVVDRRTPAPTDVSGRNMFAAPSRRRRRCRGDRARSRARREQRPARDRGRRRRRGRQHRRARAVRPRPRRTSRRAARARSATPPLDIVADVGQQASTAKAERADRSDSSADISPTCATRSPASTAPKKQTNLAKFENTVVGADQVRLDRSTRC